jgi:endonuclease/exonuclease/phosphatase (EEP) superfamily protein YafD
MSIGPRTPDREPVPPRQTERLFVRMRHRALNLVEVAVILALLSFLAGLLGEFHFLFDLASHFRVQAGVVTFLGGAILALFGSTRFGALSFFAGIALLLSTYPYFLPAPIPPAGLPVRRLLIMNVLKQNPQKQAVIDYLLEQDPDVMMLFETDAAWESALSPALADRWPHQQTVLRDDYFGVCLYSKQGWSTVRVVELTSSKVPVIDVKFEPEDQPNWRLIGTHGHWPFGSRSWAVRNEQFAAVADMVTERIPARTLVVGDLNCTPWSPNFRPFANRANLRSAALGKKLRFTWFAVPIPLAGLPIDHVLVGDEIGVLAHRVGPPLGSDHLPVIVDFTVDATEPQRRAPTAADP